MYNSKQNKQTNKLNETFKNCMKKNVTQKLAWSYWFEKNDENLYNLKKKKRKKKKSQLHVQHYIKLKRHTCKSYVFI